ncbi:threonine aldolase family protein [Aquisalinus flavus]|uniref:L-threonine aldolase n=1 Tax=Aquisalinus flavus TaxID=1526572 RepID=A0A8J2V232_9PROT|nr:low specificity L-threonine aldolase [Aquisalinus flavus]MBD0425564.1 low specificity L-threonine aldolase [Aquisalinus flavus]UNE48811.1 low specificity L-threonine aldolase [Aquisalinus flavus]GGD15046.1 L-threonine aldolase [Aquisalinus flavus]
MLFTSDNWAGVHPAIMNAIAEANDGSVPAYGNDALSRRVTSRFEEIFEHECHVFFASTGGAANGLALSQLVPPYGGTFCHEVSHVQMDECGTPEFYSGGAKLLTLPGRDAKLTAAAVEEGMRFYTPPMTHHVLPKAVSLTQVTEAGTVYTPDEIGAIGEVAKRHNLKVHMDGARFSNAIATLGCAPADVTWRAGVDVLCFGATKNGALCAEAVVFFDKAHTEEFAWRHKRAGHVWSKARFMAAQWEAFLSNDLWLDLAGNANAMAARLGDRLGALPGITIAHPVQANEVFLTFPDGVAQQLLDQGAQFYDWVYPGDEWNGQLKRLVTNYVTSEQEVDKFIDLVGRTIGNS